ncbi:MAG TPA: DUF2325 domain-containing protein [Rhodoblastus sp.]|nr:DUF2325 domain-containing protein [Rhodoblastus sp.]
MYVPSAAQGAPRADIDDARQQACAPSGTARRNIWEVRAASACSIVGTCLTLSELRKIAKKARLVDDPHRLADYDLHGLAVQRTANDNPVARALQKHLDAKFEGLIRKSKALATDGDFASFWEDALDNGLVPGAYWACVTHPRLSPAFERRIFGEVHMMSHICGASNRGDARAAAEAQRTKAELARRLSGRIAERDERLKTQEAELCALRAEISELRSAAAERDRLRGLLDSSAMPARIADLERERAALADENGRLRRACRALESQNARLQDKIDEDAFEFERASLMASFDGPRTEETSPQSPCDAEPGCDLCGRRFLYVGGRPQIVCKLREWVGKRNGELLHHDGGVEQSAGILGEMVRKADVVLFPVDCVSHGAVGSVKTLCERHGKRLCPLRTASATAFQRAIHEHLRVAE